MAPKWRVAVLLIIELSAQQVAVPRAAMLARNIILPVILLFPSKRWRTCEPLSRLFFAVFDVLERLLPCQFQSDLSMN